MGVKPTTGAGLRCTVAWTVRQHQLDYLIANSRHAGLLNLEDHGEQRARITLNASARRLDLDEATLFGMRASFIETVDQVVWLQHEARAYVRIGHDVVLGPRFERPLVPIGESPVKIDTVSSADGRKIHSVSLSLSDFHTGDRYRHRLMLDPSIAAGDLGVRLLELLIGDAECHATSGYPLAAIAKVVAQFGCPIASTIEVVGADNCVHSELGGFQVHDLVLESVSDEVFGIPKDYRDLREVSKITSTDGAAMPGFTRLEPVWIETGPRPSDSDSGSESMPLRMMIRPPGDSVPDDIDDGGKPEDPDPPASTTQAVYGLRIEQQLFDDVRNLVNQALAPLAGETFEAYPVGGLSVDWLPRLLAGVLASSDRNGNPAPGVGTFLFCLLHDVEPPAFPRNSPLPSVNVGGWGTIRGRGVLDRMATERAKELVQGGALTPAMLALLPASVVAALTSVGTNWDGLNPTDQLQVMRAVLLEDFGAPRVPLPNKFEFNWEDLVAGDFTNYGGTLTLPLASPGPPRVCPLITTLRCRIGRIEGSLRLGGIRITGTLSHWPGTTFFLLVGAGVLVTILFPALWWVLPLLVSIGTFVALDTAQLTLQISSITANFTVRFARLPNGIFQPRVDVNLTGAVSANLFSEVPTGIHQVVDAVVATVANSGRLLLDRLQEELQSILTGLTKNFLGDGFPASLLRLGVPITGGRTSGHDDQYVYIEATLDAPTNLNVPMIVVPSDPEVRLTNDLRRLSGRTDARHYLSLVSSQNTINLILAALWRAGAFNAQITAPSALHALGALARLPYPSGANVLRASAFATSPPQISLAQATPTGSNEHGMVDLKSSLILEPYADDFYEWAVTWRDRAQIVIGSVLGSSGPFVQITTGIIQPLDLLVNLTAATAQVEGIKRIQLIHRTVTVVETWFDENRKPHTRVLTEEEIVRQETRFALSAQDAIQHNPLILEALRRTLAVRDVRRAPRRDGVRANGQLSGSTDSIALQYYLFDSADPDDALPPVAASEPPVYISGDLGFDGGLLFQHLLLAGQVLEVFDPRLAPLLQNELAGVILDKLPR